MSFLKELYVLRHGETDWTRNAIAMGSTDIPLNSQGKQQVHDSLKTLKTLGINHIYTSPLLRAYESASTLQTTCLVHSQPFQSLKKHIWENAKVKL